MRYIKAPINRFIQLDDVNIPTLAGRSNQLLCVNSSGTAIESVNVDSLLNSTSSSSILLTNGQYIRAAVTGDVNIPQNSNTSTINNDVVNNAKLANMSTMTIKGNNTAVTADPKDLTITEVKLMLGLIPIDITFNQLYTLRSNNTLEVNKLYRITDFFNIVFVATTTNTLRSLYVITRVVKNEFYNGLTGSNVGVIKINTNYSVGNIMVWGGRVYTKTVNTQSITVLPTEPFDLPSMNMSLINTSNNNYYEDKVLYVDTNINNISNAADATNIIISDENNNKIYCAYGAVSNVLKCDWGNKNITNNIVEGIRPYIVNNNLSSNGKISHNIVYNGIYNNQSTDIYTNVCPTGGGITNNIGNITANNAGTGISNNIGTVSFNKSFLIFNNQCDVIGNVTGGYIISNVLGNNGTISFNICNTDISDNTNFGSILSNRCDAITSNSQRGDISNNNINGDISNNYQHASYPTAVANISFNSNNGSIGGHDTIQGNRMRGNIIYNSNNGDINGNTNTGLYSYYYNDVTISAQIGNNNCNGPINNNSNSGGIAVNSNGHEIVGNSNNGAISNNKNAGRINNNSNSSYINNNSNNGSIVSNSHRGYIADNMNNGAINNNTSTNPSGSGNNIYNNINQGYINFNNFTGNGFGIAFNVNNGNIGGTSIVNRSAALIDTQVHK